MTAHRAAARKETNTRPTAPTSRSKTLSPEEKKRRMSSFYVHLCTVVNPARKEAQLKPARRSGRRQRQALKSFTALFRRLCIVSSQTTRTTCLSWSDVRGGGLLQHEKKIEPLEVREAVVERMVGQFLSFATPTPLPALGGTPHRYRSPSPAFTAPPSPRQATRAPSVFPTFVPARSRRESRFPPVAFRTRACLRRPHAGR